MDRERRFRLLYVQHQSDVLAFFLRRLNRDDAVEAAADVFLTAWRRIDDVPAVDEARLWLFGVAHNVLLNRRRSIRRLRRLLGRIGAVDRPNPPLQPEVVVLRRAEDDAALAALQRLSPRDREVLTLRLWEEASFDDIGRVMGCSRHAAEQRYGRALRRVRSVWPQSGRELIDAERPASPRREASREAR